MNQIEERPSADDLAKRLRKQLGDEHSLELLERMLRLARVGELVHTGSLKVVSSKEGMD